MTPPCNVNVMYMSTFHMRLSSLQGKQPLCGLQPIIFNVSYFTSHKKRTMRSRLRNNSQDLNDQAVFGTFFAIEIDKEIHIVIHDAHPMFFLFHKRYDDDRRLNITVIQNREVMGTQH